MLKKIISGAQSGADLAGLKAAKKFGLETGGTMPFGFKAMTDSGKPTTHPEYQELYGIEVHSSSSYVPRTRKNVQDSDGTIRLAFNFDSAGEKCTLKAIQSYNKPYIDVDLSEPRPIKDVIDWIKVNKIQILNVAGNSESTYAGTHQKSFEYLCDVLEGLDVQ